MEFPFTELGETVAGTYLGWREIEIWMFYFRHEKKRCLLDILQKCDVNTTDF